MKLRRVPKSRSTSAPLPPRGANSRRAATRKSAAPASTAFPIVGIGASAGGLQALQAFFDALPPAPPAAFVVVQHLSPDFRSFMVELLAKHTAMRVQRAEHAIPVAAGNVYLIPPKVLLTISAGRLQLEKTDPRRGLHLPIDQFFLSLAEDQTTRAVGIVLSGTGSDGTAGIRAIKDAGGLVLVQNEESAQFDGMPRSAIATGLADYVLPPGKMAAQLVSHLQHPTRPRAAGRTLGRGADPLLNEILALLRQQCGVDFSHYKSATIDRRIERRMNVCQIASLADYVRHLAHSPREIGLLFDELLINVTSFFRDRAAWDTLAKDALPSLLKNLGPNEPFRAWVAGCSSGEEAYSLAMLVAEQMDRLRLHRPVKIFATDIAKEALGHAARGYYSPSELTGVSPARLQQFFAKESSGYRVRTRLREMVVFASHNVLSDPPFTKLSLVSCRNLLIYLQGPMQQRVLTLFSFALQQGGVLFLGGSESIGDATDRFHPLATRANLYRNRRSGQPPPPLSPSTRVVRPATDPSPALRRASARLSAGEMPTIEEIHRCIAEEFAPACLVIDHRDEVVHILGSAGDYLRHPPGGFTRNIFKLTAHNFASALRSSLIRGQQKNDTFTHENVRFKIGRKTVAVRLHVRPMLDAQGKSTGVRLVLIEPAPAPAAPPGRPGRDDAPMSARITELERDLSLTRDSLQATVQDLESSNEEIQAANEELLAANEELQSTNEELQSVNEELHTVNAENQSRIEELSQLTSDINNLLATASIGVLLVDAQLRVRRASRSALLLLDLTEADLGVPVETVARILRLPDLPAMAQRVIGRNQPEETEIERLANRWLLLRCVPFRNELGHIQGVVLSLVDLTERHESEKRLRDQVAITQSVLDTMDASVAVVDRDGCILYQNKAWRDAENHPIAPAPGELDVGSNYFEACETAARAGHQPAAETLAGMRQVLRGELPRFSYDYADVDPRHPRWYRVHALPLNPSESGIAVAHFNLTPQQPLDSRVARSSPPSS
ncbi:chemotaxis protein CheB [Opitutus sp. ER46]|uniref:chemotaxis protein CheB n=1 Tax=Opitutus sp. ER46 TaxID=2161864 RepID=UPI000D2FCBF2|nr:chemotaxis protein CheB [Opitutus sp. ER46]PTX91492.1 chemotaxis protein [Opitutus sp. ER46]